MINWILIVILVLAGFLIIRFMFSRHAKHRFMFTIIMVIILVFISTFYFVTNANHVDVTTVNGLGTGMQVYGVWMLHSFSNIKSLTGYAVGLDWKGNTTVNNGSSTSPGTDNVNIIDSGKKAGQEAVNLTVNGVTQVVKPNQPKLITDYK